MLQVRLARLVHPRYVCNLLQAPQFVFPSGLDSTEACGQRHTHAQMHAASFGIRNHGLFMLFGCRFGRLHSTGELKAGSWERLAASLTFSTILMISKYQEDHKLGRCQYSTVMACAWPFIVWSCKTLKVLMMVRSSGMARRTIALVDLDIRIIRIWKGWDMALAGRIC